MNTVIPHIKGFNKILLVLLYFFSSGIIFSQPVKFDFNSLWGWEDLINNAVLINPVLLKTIDEQKRIMNVNDARLILKELSKLNSLYELKEMTNIVFGDNENSIEEKQRWDSVFRNSFENIQGEINMENLLNAAAVLSKIRYTYLSDEKFSFREKEYLPQPVKALSKKIEINFDYSDAEIILDYFDDPETGMENIIKCCDFKDMLNKRIPGIMDEDRLEKILTESIRDIPLYNIYKWVNPGCYKDIGGAFIYKKNFREIISTLKNNESNIKSDVDKHISRYLHDSIIIKTDIHFSLGEFFGENEIEKNKINIALENFGDDYDYIVRYIIHNVVKVAEKEIKIPVFGYVPEYQDRIFVSLMHNIMENGIANYIGPVGTETRPWDLLEKDFNIFNRTFSSIYKNESKNIIDSMIKTGFMGNAPFYTMSTQMAYIIENTLGRNSLIESISLGPVSFFLKYIKAYKEYPDEIRKVFRFSNSLEKKIRELSHLFPETLIEEALRIKNKNYTGKELEIILDDFIKSGHSGVLKYFLSGQLLLESGNFEKASHFFKEGVNQKNDRSGIAGLIGKSFEDKGAYMQALDFYNLNAEYSPDNYKAFEMRGKYFYKEGEYKKALEDFENAKRLNPVSREIEIYIDLLKNSEK